MAFLFDIRRFSVHDGPGIRTTLFFKGCPLACPWCHNPEGKDPYADCYHRKQGVGDSVFIKKEIVGKSYTTGELMLEILKDRHFYEESGGGVTFSGGEPFMQADALIELLSACREEKIHTAIDTSGYVSEEIFTRTLPLANLFLFDIKHSNNLKHIDITGVSNEKILANLKILYEKKVKVVIRIPVIPGMNADKENMRGTAGILKNNREIVERVDLLPFHTLGNSKYYNMKMQFAQIPPLGDEVIQEWQQGLKSFGFITTIGG